MPVVTVGPAEFITVIQKIQAANAAADAAEDAASKNDGDAALTSAQSEHDAAIEAAKQAYEAAVATADAALAAAVTKSGNDQAAAVAATKFARETRDAELAGLVQFLSTGAPASISLPDPVPPVAAA